MLTTGASAGAACTRGRRGLPSCATAPFKGGRAQASARQRHFYSRRLSQSEAGAASDPGPQASSWFPHDATVHSSSEAESHRRLRYKRGAFKRMEKIAPGGLSEYASGLLRENGAFSSAWFPTRLPHAPTALSSVRDTPSRGTQEGRLGHFWSGLPSPSSLTALLPDVLSQHSPARPSPPHGASASARVPVGGQSHMALREDRGTKEPGQRLWGSQAATELIDADRDYRGSRVLWNSSPSCLRHSERRLVGVSAEEYFSVVQDVATYHEFVPWCKESRLLTPVRRHRDGQEKFEAELVVGFGIVSDRYTSSVSTLRPRGVNCWEFRPLPGTTRACSVDFTIEFEFNNVLHQHLAGVFLTDVAATMGRCFDARVTSLYGLSPLPASSNEAFAFRSAPSASLARLLESPSSSPNRHVRSARAAPSEPPPCETRERYVCNSRTPAPRSARGKAGGGFERQKTDSEAAREEGASCLSLADVEDGSRRLNSCTGGQDSVNPPDAERAEHMYVAEGCEARERRPLDRKLDDTPVVDDCLSSSPPPAILVQKEKCPATNADEILQRACDSTSVNDSQAAGVRETYSFCLSAQAANGFPSPADIAWLLRRLKHLREGPPFHVSCPRPAETSPPHPPSRPQDRASERRWLLAAPRGFLPRGLGQPRSQWLRACAARRRLSHAAWLAEATSPHPGLLSAGDARAVRQLLLGTSARAASAVIAVFLAFDRQTRARQAPVKDCGRSSEEGKDPVRGGGGRHAGRSDRLEEQEGQRQASCERRGAEPLHALRQSLGAEWELAAGGAAANDATDARDIRNDERELIEALRDVASQWREPSAGVAASFSRRSCRKPVEPA
ncbi:polyketide cyclase/dehydrase [Besnoitia besnoiti]|uniref:Polyketide cyclase/dehydrase n=1 Tax=Besnoitia besnoiti TaxID=94643 RepID=A0A2A9MPA0_BESBE|nr:polyketide cyclase/dehydrase [Besnoitia besnoiti]PFH38481.1 polyketide cyclase/dehydrase [Besnoitia besnoiti]